MLLLFFIIGSVIAFVFLLLFLFQSSVKTAKQKSSYVQENCIIGNETHNGKINMCEAKSLKIQISINSLVKELFPSCSWLYDGNKMELPFQEFIDVEVYDPNGNFYCTERVQKKSNDDTMVVHCQTFKPLKEEI